MKKVIKFIKSFLSPRMLICIDVLTKNKVIVITSDDEKVKYFKGNYINISIIEIIAITDTICCNKKEEIKFNRNLDNNFKDFLKV